MAGETFTRNPDGSSTLNPGAGMAPLGPSTTGGVTGTGADPYTILNQNLASMLSQLQIKGSQNKENIGRGIAGLTNSAVASSTGYDPYASTATNAGNQAGSFGSFAPALAGANTQLQNFSTGVSDLGTAIAGMETAYAPIAVSPGQSIVSRGGTVIHQGHSYTPTINPQTGLIDGFDQNSGTWSSEDNGLGGSNGHTGMGVTAGGADNGIEAVFGASNPIGAYATDPNYVQEISGLYGTVKQLGVSATAPTLNEYIANNAKGSPVTGQMIINAANTYGLDPALLTTVLLHESDFGTAGAAVNTMNPGNQGNTGTSTQSFPSWQQGVNATAKNLAARIKAAGIAPGADTAPATPTTAPQATSPVGGNFAPEAATKVSAMPAALRSYVDAGPLGIAYINSDRVPQEMKTSVQTLASRAGIPYVSDADAGAVKAMQTVIQNLDSMQKLADNNLSSGMFDWSALGHANNALMGGANKFLQTDWGNNLSLFDNYRDTAIKAVQALAGGAGSGLRINGAEIAANVQNLPSSGGSLQNATLKVRQLKQLIYTQLATTFPYAPVPIQDAEGHNGTIPAANLSAAIQRGATVQ